jgi:hypothetical protein
MTGGGVINRGAGAGGAGGLDAGGALAVAATGGATGAASLVSTGGAGGRGGGTAVACCCFVISLSTSPGLEMCERSILVLISSDSRVARDERLGAPCASAAARK